MCVREKARELEAVTAKQQGSMMMMLLLLLLQRKMFWRCTFCHISGYISSWAVGEGEGQWVLVSGSADSLRASRERESPGQILHIWTCE